MIAQDQGDSQEELLEKKQIVEKVLDRLAYHDNVLVPISKTGHPISLFDANFQVFVLIFDDYLNRSSGQGWRWCRRRTWWPHSHRASQLCWRRVDSAIFFLTKLLNIFTSETSRFYSNKCLGLYYLVQVEFVGLGMVNFFTKPRITFNQLWPDSLYQLFIKMYT